MNELTKGETISTSAESGDGVSIEKGALYAALDSVRIEFLKRLTDIQPQISDMGILELCVNALHRARNCDRFQTASEVAAYWNSNVRTVPLPHDAYGMHIDGKTYPTFLDWLMAPTKEVK